MAKVIADLSAAIHAEAVYSAALRKNKQLRIKLFKLNYATLQVPFSNMPHPFLLPNFFSKHHVGNWQKVPHYYQGAVIGKHK